MQLYVVLFLALPHSTAKNLCGLCFEEETNVNLHNLMQILAIANVQFQDFNAWFTVPFLQLQLSLWIRKTNIACHWLRF